jgi:steroid delta-isomerase-like uncharacterized protein
LKIETYIVIRVDGVDTTLPTGEAFLPLSEQPEKGAFLMSPEENKAIVRRFVEEAQSRGNISAVDQFLTADFVDHSPFFGLPPTREGVKQLFTMLRTAFPDLQATIHDQVAERDKVVTRKTFYCTHQGELLGIPATGKQVAIDVIDILQLAGGKITDHWAVVDLLGLMQQLGIIPPTGQAS